MKALSKYFRVGLAVAGLALMGLSVRAQNDGSDNTTNAALEAAASILSNAVAQLSEFIPTNEVASNGVAQAEQTAEGTNVANDTNLPAPGNGSIQPGPMESRRAWMLRQRAGAPSTNEPGGPGNNLRMNGAADSLFRPLKPEYTAFKLITDRNIFDPNRTSGRHEGPPTKVKIVESFGLVGVMSYAKGTFAFFDGSSSDYKKAVKLADTIAGYKVATIEPNTINLVSGTNHVELHVGMQLRREEGGGWVPSAQSEAYHADSSSPSAAHSDAGGSGSDNDVLERLRKKRESE